MRQLLLVVSVLLLATPCSTEHITGCEGFDANVLDPSDPSDYCDHQIESGTPPNEGQVCLSHPEKVFPSQAVYGEVDSMCIMRHLEALAKKKDGSLKRYLMKKQAPAVLGPEGNIFITDHHHLTAALLRAFMDYAHPKQHRVLYVCVTRDLRELTQTTFWTMMLSFGLAWLHDEKGREIDIDQLPRSVKYLRDDPYRTLAHYMRRSCAYVKCGKRKEDRMFKQCEGGKIHAPPFIELQWADIYRKEFASEDIYIESQQAQVNAFREIMSQVLNFSLSEQNKHIKGWNQEPELAGLVDIDKYGCVVNDHYSIVEEIAVEQHIESDFNSSFLLDIVLDVTV